MHRRRLKHFPDHLWLFSGPANKMENATYHAAGIIFM